MIKKDKKDYSLLVRCNSEDVKKLRKANINVCEEVRVFLRQAAKKVK
jgi:hypothetical protein